MKINKKVCVFRSVIKYVFMTGFVFVWFLRPGYAMDVTLSWDANIEPDLAGYFLYYKTDPNALYTDKIIIGDPNATTHTVDNLNNIKTYFVITAYDISGLESDYSNEVSTSSTITDSDPPVPDIDPLPAISGQCEVTLTPPTATDDIAGPVIGVTDDPLTYDTQGTYTVNWTYNDDYGNTSTQAQVVIIDDTQLPVSDIDPLPDITAECGITLIPPTATDNCTGTITATTNAPNTYDTQGTYPVTWEYDDGHGNTTTQSQTIIVSDSQAPVPNIATLPDVTGECEVILTPPTANDNCAGTITATTNDPIIYDTQGTYTVTWEYDDGHGNTTTQTQMITVDDSLPPVLDTDIIVECEVTLIPPIAHDNCAGTITATTNDPITYNTQGTYTVNWEYSDGHENIATQQQTVIVSDSQAPVPDVATLLDITGECEVSLTPPMATDNCAGPVTGTTSDSTTYDTQGTYTVTWEYNDGHGNTTMQSQTVIVADSQASVPDVATLPDITGECEVTVTAPMATDNCIGLVTGTTNDSTTYDTQGTYIVNWEYDDGQGNIATQQQTVIISDSHAPGPDVATLPDVTGECEVTMTPPTATDNCAATITGTTSDPTTYDTQGTYTVTWEYNDGHGNTTMQSQTVIVSDTQAPVPDVATLPDIIGECEVNVTAPTATDNCAGPVTGTTSDPTTYDIQGTYTVTWEYNDGHGNITTQSQTVIVSDNLAPIPDVATLPDVTGECEVNVTAPTANDNCIGLVTGTTNDLTTYDTQGTYIVNWEYDDGQGNIATQQQTVIVADNQAPIPDVANLPNITGECEVNVTAPTANDNCIGLVTGTTNDLTTYDTQGTYTVTWEYGDGQGNIATQQQTVIVSDNHAPVPDVATLPDITGACEVSLTPPTANDNCIGLVTGTTSGPTTYDIQGTYTVTWEYNDGHGNITTQSQTVIVSDTQAPVPDVVTLPDITGECEVNVTAPTATDNCSGTITGTTTDLTTYDTSGTYIVNWEYNDGQGNIATQQQTVIVADSQAPVPDVVTLPDITGECEVNVTAPTATDNCLGTITGTTTDPTTYDTKGTYTVTWEYDDSHGNIATQQQTVIVADSQAPIPDVATLPDITGECEVSLTPPTASDNCAGLVTATTNDPTTYDTQGNYTVTWEYDDGQGNIATQQQTVIVSDNQAPVPDVATLPDVTGECGVTLTPPTASDNCAGLVTATTNDPTTYNTQGTYTVTWEYDDGHGNTTTQSQTVIVSDNQAPVPDVATLPDVTGECEVTLTLPTAIDNCIGPVTGTTSDPITYNTQGTYTVTWEYNDGQGSIATQQQTVIVADSQAPIPDVATLPNITGECEVNVTAPTATDNCAGAITGTTNDPTTYNSQGTYIVNWEYDDSQGNTTTQSQTVIVADSQAPIADVATLSDVTGDCEVNVTAPTATDNCAGMITGTTNDPIIYNTQGTYTVIWEYDDGHGNIATQQQTVIVSDAQAPIPDIATLPDVIGECEVTLTPPTAIDNCIGPVTGTTSDPITYNSQGTYTVTWEYDDGHGNTTTQSQTVVVSDSQAPVPGLANLPDVTGECEVTLTPPTAIDNCIGPVTGTTNDPTTYDTSGTYTVTWEYDDGNGNATTQSQIVIVSDTEAPVPDIATLPDISGECAVTVTAPTATDNCAGAITGTTNDPTTYNTQGTYTVTWEYDDSQGNTTTQPQTVIVADIQAPVPDIATLPDITGECEVTLTPPTATDNCAGTITGTTNDPITYNTQGTYTVTWEYDDWCGNTTTQPQTLIVVDTQAPVPDLATLPDVTNECGVTLTPPTATDNCIGPVTGTTNDPTTYDTSGTFTVTWDYDDGQGNTTTQPQTVIVADNQAPIPDLATLPDETGECEVTLTPPTAIDNCIGPVTATTSDPIIYNTQGTYTVTWEYDDGQGNIATQSQTVIVSDNQAPVPDVSTLPDVIGECEVTVTAPTATDNCIGPVTGTTNDPTTYNSQGTYTVTWEYNDGQGNIATQSQTVIVADSQAPVPELATLPDVANECGVTLTPPTATDNCIGPVTGTTNDPTNYDTSGTYTVTWEYDDGNGNTTTQSQTIIVSDSQGPVPDLATLPDVTGECEITLTPPTATDNCTGPVTATTNDPIYYDTQGAYMVTWVYDDGHGNSVNQWQRVIIEDTQQPIPDIDPLPNVTAECEVTLTSPTGTDNCAGQITATTNDPITYSTQGTYTVTWTYNDGHGITFIQWQSVIIDDTQAPVPDIDPLPDVTGEDTVSLPPPTATDNCAGTLTATTNDPVTYDTPGNYTVIWIYDDEYGNTITQSQEAIVGSTAIAGDLDGDGDVDVDDYLIFRSAYGSCEGDSNFVPGADLDGDGCVTTDDYLIFRTLMP